MTRLLAFDDELPLAEALARALEMPLALIARHRFPDGETRLRLPADLSGTVLVLRGLQQPNEKLTELLLAAAGARELGAQRLMLISPYLAYMRQDMAFTPGEVVSQRHLGALLAAAFDAVLTVDPHLHRIERLEQAIAGRHCITLSAASLIGPWLAQQVPGALLVGPDAESAQWVGVAAAAAGLDHAVCSKLRQGDRDVEVSLPEGVAVCGRAAVLIDDVASTGQTLLQALRRLQAAGAASVDVAVTHGLFVGDALARLRAAGVRHVWSTDCVHHETNALSVVPLMAAALRPWLAGPPPGS
ncbi:MAG: ribose-phosphate diphosphokinase [Rubrivivax sp.]|nr:ribose-phosphate diphosphokinase [Rubrivivax sp.]